MESYEGFDLKLTTDQEIVLGTVVEKHEDLKVGDEVVGDFFGCGVSQGVLEKEYYPQDDDEIGLCYPCGSDSVCSVYFASKMVLKKDFEDALTKAGLPYPSPRY